tara:strand:+ start:203 stop:421 length:219 start_codon:yes stop_codon:yes gene_type:complete
MKRCENEVSYFTGEMPNYTERLVKCGTTNPYGKRTICDDCRSNPKIMEEIRRHQANVDADNQWLRSAGWGEM